MSLVINRLPVAYQEVTYIESGKEDNVFQYINTGVDVPCKIKAKIRFKQDKGRQLMGTRSTYQMWIGSTATNLYEFNNVTDFKLNGTATASGTAATGNVDIIEATFGGLNTSAFIIGALYDYSGSITYQYACTAKYYYFKIYDLSGELLRDYVPCYRKSDSVIGLYDLVNDVFYTNAGTGSFIKDADVVSKAAKSITIPEGNVKSIARNGSVIWRELKFNQLIPNGNFANASGWEPYDSSYVTLSIANNKATVTTIQPQYAYQTAIGRQDILATSSHTFYLCATMKVVGAQVNRLMTRWLFAGTSAAKTMALAGSGTLFTKIMTIGSSYTYANKLYFYINSIETGLSWEISNIMLIDLTAMYGAGNEPTTVAQLKADCLAIGYNLDEYQPYTPIT